MEIFGCALSVGAASKRGAPRVDSYGTRVYCDFRLLNMTVIETDDPEGKGVIFSWDFADSVYGQGFATRNTPLCSILKATLGCVGLENK